MWKAMRGPITGLTTQPKYAMHELVNLCVRIYYARG